MNSQEENIDSLILENYEHSPTDSVFREILNDEELFKTVKILGNSGTICWDNEVDIAVEFLYFKSELFRWSDEEKNKVLEIPKSSSSIVCNNCGVTKELIGESWEIEVLKNEFQSFQCSFHYGSRYDYEQWTFDICEDCLTAFVKSFKHAPLVLEW